MPPAIRVDNLSKLYRVGSHQQGYKTLRESIVDACSAPFRRWRAAAPPLSSEMGDQKRLSGENFWALRDVSFEVQPGEVVGIIGRNGAGKSTLLKILSRITEPTGGQVELRGRVGSLLEVGTGFHPELSGRENIYMNGSILGMSRREIARKFDEIVDFSEVEDFLDTPVKRYSSGMYVRLAFAVAAHLEPEILIVDEVLAVGDAGFQRKCLQKIDSIARHGRTVVFVTHNLGTVRTYCQTACWLSDGLLRFRGDVGQAVREYLSDSVTNDATGLSRLEKPHSARLWMTTAQLTCGASGKLVLETGDAACLEVAFESNLPIAHPKLGFAICTQDGISLVSANNRYQTSIGPTHPLVRGVFRCSLGVLPLLEGRYYISLWLGDDDGNTHFVQTAVSFDVSDRDAWGSGQLANRHGYFWWPTTFEILCEDAHKEVVVAE